MCKRVAVVLGQGAFGRGPDMAKYQARGGFGRNSMEVRAVPRRDCRSKETGSGAELGVGVKAYAKAIRVVLATSSVLETRSLVRRVV